MIRLCGLALWMVLLGPLTLSAAPLIVSAQHNGPAIESFVEALAQTRPQDNVQFMELNALAQANLPQDARLITLDYPTFRWRIEQSNPLPTLALRLRRHQLPETALPPRLSVLLSDPPLSRQLHLATLIQPNIRRVGVLHPAGFTLEPKILKLAKALSVELVLVPWTNSTQRRALIQALQTSDILLAINNDELYNPSSIKNILLTSYGLNRALIGPTGNFVAAGSLASTYSDQSDWLHTLNALLDQPTQRWPNVAYPTHFKVQLNRQVARALGLELPEPEDLQARIIARELTP